MAKILLDYVMPISVITPTPEASTAFLKQACLVVKPKTGQEGNVGTIYECATMAAVSARTDNLEAQQAFNAGMSRVYILLADDLDLADSLNTGGSDFWTLLISSDFDDADVEATAATGNATVTSYANLIDTGFDTIAVAGVVFTAQAGAATLGTATFQAATSNNATATSLAAQINAHATTSAKVTAVANAAAVAITAKQTGPAGNLIALAYVDHGTATVGATVSGAFLTGGDGFFLGAFDGVVGLSSEDQDVLQTWATGEGRCGFFRDDANGAKNMVYAFGKLLSNLANWTNQQYVPMPFDDNVDDLGVANALFDDKISFVLHDTEFGDRLALFCAGGKAIAAPYIGKNLRIDLQSRTVQWISANQPSYTKVNAALLETRLQVDVVNVYIDEPRAWIEDGSVSVALLADNFVGTAEIHIAEPGALWRVFGELRQDL